jgi:Holliday junction resolvase-like predicted endonuclease
MNTPPVILAKKRKFPLESKVESYLAKEVRSQGWDSYKFSSPNNRGVFDRIICIDDGSVVFVEVKAMTGKPSNPQAIFAGKLEHQSQQWCYVYCMIGVDQLMHDLINCRSLEQIYNEPPRRKAIPHIKVKL